MSKQNIKKLVPELRFKGFSDEWTAHKIGDFIASHKGGAALTPSDFTSYSDCEVIPKKAISDGGWLKIDSDNPTYCKEEFYTRNLQSVVDSTYLIITLRDLVPSGPSIGYIVKYVGNKKYILAQGVYGFKPKQTIVADFLIYFSNTDIYRKMMHGVMVGSTQVHIRNGEYLNLPISVTSLEEQQKIADCLSSIDELITAQTQQLDGLKTYKKGLMQQLFPAEGETLPKLRFPEFGDAGEWEEKPLESICSSISSGKDKSDANGTYDLYGSTGVIGKTSSNTFAGNFILAARVGANAGLLTRATGKFGVTDNTLVIFLKKSEKIDFIYYSLDRLGLNKMVFGSGQPLITGRQLKNLGINLPSPKEQQKIADCLSSIDDLIAAVSQKIDALKNHKKGLMQQLFPSTDEVAV